MTRKRQSRPKGCLHPSCALDNDGGSERSRQSGGQRDRNPGRSGGEAGKRESGGRRQDNRSPETGTQAEAETQEEGATGDSETSPKGGARSGDRWTPGWADRPPSSSSQSPHLLGEPPAAAAATITPDSFWPCLPPPCSPSPIAPAIISLVQNELLQLQPRQLFHPGASTGAGWLNPRGAYVLQGGMRMGRGEMGSLDTLSPIPFKGS